MFSKNSIRVKFVQALFSPLTIALLIQLFVATGHSFWYSPFGWDAWGNRLGVPWTILSLTIVLCESGKSVQRLLTGLIWLRSFLLTILLPAVVLSTAHIYAILNWDEVVSLVYPNFGLCSSGQPSFEGAVRCIGKALWENPVIPLLTYFQPRPWLTTWLPPFTLSIFAILGGAGIWKYAIRKPLVVGGRARGFV